MKIISFIIILLFPLTVLAHGVSLNLEVSATILPGDFKYAFELLGEWFAVNLFTLSTKQKQAKKLELAEERLAEFRELLLLGQPEPKALQKTLRRYESLLRDARDMAEKIIFLDGKEIALAERVERQTRLYEQVLLETLEEVSPSFAPLVLEALMEARIQNEVIFKFMVKNYQFNEDDIRKHQAILEAHLQDLEERLGAAEPNLLEARKFQKAGLNSEAYEWMKKGKNKMY